MHPGDTVAVETKTQTYQGIVMPSVDKKVFVLKLESGYNLALERKKITKIKVVQAYNSVEKASSSSVSPKKGLKNVAILHTGGTLASKVSYQTGGVVAKFTPEELISMFPELPKIINTTPRLIRNMFSEDLNFNHYNLLAEEVAKEIKNKVDGIIITHGTDTLHFTAAALAFSLEHLSIPVILVGAQRSSDRGSSDASLNLLCAAQFIAQTNFIGVGICMHETTDDLAGIILPATKTRKMHTSRRDAFKAINSQPWARVSRTGEITIITKFHDPPKAAFTVKPFNPDLKIGLLKSHPHLQKEELAAYKNFDGLVLEGTGFGHFPINNIDEFTKENTTILKTIETLAKKLPVVMSSQCLSGKIDLDVYETGRKLQEAGVVGNSSDMTPETTFIKLAWLVSNHPKECKELLTKNLRGEISERQPYQQD
ncbi:Glu-tRNA(Gln) amidotransferase subunit GatD [Candidatus Woesearchaeota archaeon]|nr:Glu-tRNA(Gln) amidotransferase subunit GatD [Candidatus Woesearchaeota archaeon]